MALDPVDEFLKSKPTYLSTLDRNIASNKQARRAAQQGARGLGNIDIGRNKLPGGGAQPSFLNPKPVGATLPGAPASPLALPPGGNGAVPARVMAGGQQMPPGAAQLGAGAPKIQATQIPGGNALGTGQRAIGSGAQGIASQGAQGPLQGPVAGQAAGTAGRTINGVQSKAAGAVARSGAATTKAASGMLEGKGLAGIFGNVTKASAMRGAGIAGTGYMLSGIIDGLDIGGENNLIDRAGSAGILGMSIGAGGAVALGIPHVAAAAAGGALLFGGYKALFGNKKTTVEGMTDIAGDTRETITSIASMYGLGPDATEDIMMQFDASTKLMIDQEDKAGLKNYLTGLTSQLPAMMLAQKDEQGVQEKETERYDRMMQMQAQFAPMFERQLETANASSERAFQVRNTAVDVIQNRQPQLAALIRSSAADDNAAQARLMAAYGKQIAMGPAQAGDTTELQRRLEQEQLLNQYIG